MKTLDEFALLTGLQRRDKVVFGLYRGYPVQLVSAILDNWRLTVSFRVAADYERARMFEIKRAVRAAGLVGKGKVMPDHIFIEMAGLLGRARAPQIIQVLDSVIGFISGAPVASPIPVAPGSLAAPAGGVAIGEFADLTGMRREGNAAFGQYRGYLVKLTAALTDHYADYSEMMVMFPQAGDHVRVGERLDVGPILEDAGLAGNGRVDPGRVSIGMGEGQDRPEAAQIKRALDGVIDVMAELTPPYGNVCMECGGLGVERTVLASGMPFMLCRPCLHRATEDLPETRVRMGFARERTGPDYGTGLTYGILAMIGMAFLWGMISAATNLTFYYLGFIVGFAVAYANAYGAKKVTGGVLTLGIILAMVASFLGEVLFIVFLLMKEGIPLGYFAEAFGWYLEAEPWNFALAMMLGLVGAGVASYVAHTSIGMRKRR
ncbi:MAG: hypothetical protein LN415_09140 [Candidatus Thermoplasmatota archaeon]|nr:hypothetical protein [Candidatus Thermoplasmatota archaeon]